MPRSPSAFRDRRDAGLRLAEVLETRHFSNPVVLALPRGGVPVAFEIARALRAPLDLMLVRKIGAPGNPEYGIGAVIDGSHPQMVLNEEAMAILRPSATYVNAERQRQLEEIERRRAFYLGGRPPVSLKGRTAIVVDDGIATGGTIRVALKALHATEAAFIVLAVPAAPQSVIESLRSEADEIICLGTPEPFHAVGLYYKNFEQTSDEEVVALLREAESFSGGSEPPPQGFAPKGSMRSTKSP
ncbi:phosphoribosyltransferase [Beijerinckia indica]|uniref:Phosphoribosyltransferase n=1 Tax=Beijerinckia indica subsp. indica (strain ATCC 9039 / DSM 1715 / NCIMB 8712) TaxID=395963 RepID=B2II19_BEII9|nr:phosphoribosyltransferase [Beijerinckia indica]ACB94602.1 phosphoribosyltransferase [Beijerinckia indica subsp. indica ATCC 9039]